MKWGIGSVLALLLLFSLSVSAFAVTENNSDILDKIDIQIHEKCSGHPFFVNYLVREDGWFAVYYRTSDKSNSDDGIFKLAYIDIFNSEGEFLREIQFDSRDAIILNFSEGTLEIYLYEWLISVDLETWETVATQTNTYFAQDSDLNSAFNQKKQKADGWRYTCRGTSMMYTSLIREKEGNEEVLLSLSGNVPGTGRSMTSVAVCGVVSGIVIMLFSWQWKRKRKCNT